MNDNHGLPSTSMPSTHAPGTPRPSPSGSTPLPLSPRWRPGGIAGGGQLSLLLAAALGWCGGFTLRAAEQTPPAATNELTAAASADSRAATNAVAGTNAATASSASDASGGTTNAGPPIVAEDGSEGVLLNFRGAPLNLVLDYISDAAGFIINKETEVRGTVEVWSKKPVTKDETVTLLDSLLRKNGYCVMRNGRILTIKSLENIKTDPDNPVVVGSKPEDVEASDAVETRIIPVLHANATQLMNNLQVLLPLSANLSVNESANSIIMVATKRDIRRMLHVVTALDSSMSGATTVKVFQLHYADAKQLATEITTLFAQPNQNQGGRGGFGFPFPGFGGRGGGGNTATTPNNGANAASARVTAASDDYSNSLVVNAAPDVMETIATMVEQIDRPTTDITELRIFHLIHADPTEVADQLTQLFPDTSQSSSTGGQNFGFRFFGGRGGGNQATSSDRTKKKSTVIAVADPRTSSVLVAAATELMPHIEDMIKNLDSINARKEIVTTFDLQNADPQDVQQILTDLFNRQNTQKSSSANSRSLLGQNNPLLQRSTQNQTTTSSSSGFGSTGRGGGGGATGF